MTQTIESKGQRFLPTLGVLLDRACGLLTGIAFWLVGAVLLTAFTPFGDCVRAVWSSPAMLPARTGSRRHRSRQYRRYRLGMGWYEFWFVTAGDPAEK